MKPGFISTEFYVFLGTLATTALNKKLGLDIDPSVLTALIGAAVGYIVQRGWVKVKTPQTSLVGQAPILPPFTITPETAAKLGLDK